MKPKHPDGPPMTLGNMRELGMHHLIASCLNHACRRPDRQKADASERCVGVVERLGSHET
jgi:hypothetical protein